MTQQGSRLQIHPQSRQVQTTSFTLPELSDDEVRIQVLYSGISRDDVQYLQGKNNQDYFGVAVVGRVVAVAKNVGARKNGEIVGVYYDSINKAQYATGYSTYLQVHANRTVYIPDSIPLEQASGLLGDGVVAYNSLQKLSKGSVIAVIGTGNLAYLTVQFAKKVFGFTVTVLSLSSTEGVKQSFGCDAVDILSLDTIKKNDQKFDAVIVAQPVNPQQATVLQSLAIRTGKLICSAKFGYSLKIKFFELITSQREFIGVKRGDKAQYLKALQAAAFSNIRGRVEVHPSTEYKAAFTRAKEINYNSEVVLKY